jgi:hypothetical protein
MRLPLELDTDPPRRRSVAGKPPPKKGGPGEGPTKTSNELNRPLRRIEQQGKQIRFPVFARPGSFCKPYRKRLLLALVDEFESWIAGITTPAPPTREREILAHLLHALAVAKRRAIPRRGSRRTASTPTPVELCQPTQR